MASTRVKQSVHVTLRALRGRGVLDSIDELARTITADQLAICEIPAPPFGEGRRAQYLCERLASLGLAEISKDEEGNVIALVQGGARKPVVVIAAHLDTVFPDGLEVRVRVENGRLYAPGISDNASGLAALLALARAIRSYDLAPDGTLILLATVGEEAHGNLRGVRHFFARNKWVLESGVDAFIALDGHGLERIVHRGLGSRRFRVQMSGPGGHSWGDFGMVNPIHAIANLVVRLAEYPFGDEPRSSLNVGMIRGGRSVNAIPQTASVDVDMRSTDGARIDRLEEFLRRAAEETAVLEQHRVGDLHGRIQVEVQLLGERPAGEIPQECDLLQVAIQATRAFGIEPKFESASTDANIPISMGIPAIALGSGGLAGGVHTLHEWYDPCTRETGIKRVLLTALTMVGLAS